MGQYIKIYVTSASDDALTGYRLISINNIKTINQSSTTVCKIFYADPAGGGAIDKVELTVATMAANSPKLVDNIVAAIEKAQGQIYPIPAVDLTGIGVADADITCTALSFSD